VHVTGSLQYGGAVAYAEDGYSYPYADGQRLHHEHDSGDWGAAANAAAPPREQRGWGWFALGLCCLRRRDQRTTRLPNAAEEAVTIVPPALRRSCCKEQTVAVWVLVISILVSVLAIVTQITTTVARG
jgi:hypothetical protein